MALATISHCKESLLDFAFVTASGVNLKAGNKHWKPENVTIIGLFFLSQFLVSFNGLVQSESFSWLAWVERH